jgi:hypothetical protein
LYTPSGDPRALETLAPRRSIDKSNLCTTATSTTFQHIGAQVTMFTTVINC